MYDSNLNWVKVTVARPDEIARVHAAISNGLARDRLRAPIDDVIVIKFRNRHASEGVEDVRSVIDSPRSPPRTTTPAVTTSRPSMWSA